MSWEKRPNARLAEHFMTLQVFNKLSTGEQTLDSIHYMTLKVSLKSQFWHENHKFCHNVPNIVMDVIAGLY